MRVNNRNKCVADYPSERRVEILRKICVEDLDETEPLFSPEEIHMILTESKDARRAEFLFVGKGCKKEVGPLENVHENLSQDLDFG